MHETLAMILAGGVGSRLNVLVSHRAKPAVPFGGIYRIIDFALSNTMNSGLTRAAVLTQYKPLSLMRHIGTGSAWDFTGRTRIIEILPPRTGEKDSDWYKGTADAVRQNMDFIQARPSRQILILSGDHIYHMDYRDMVNHHRKTGAEVTVAMMPVPLEDTHHFGIGILDDKGRIVDWEEKPKKARSNLASLGIYVFNTPYLLDALNRTKDVDFGHHIIPQALADGVLFAYRFNGYWRDVGTIHAFWDANMDLLRPASGLYPENWGIATNLDCDLPYDRPPIQIHPGARVANSAIAPGCSIHGTVVNSVLSPGVKVERGAEVHDSVLMHDVLVETGAVLSRVIADKYVSIGHGCRIGIGDPSIPNKRYPKHLSTGLTVIGKWAVCPAGTKVGTNCIVGPRVSETSWAGIPSLPDGDTIEA
ncbi:MAG: glucose-1-phosphate adenylyltransferase [Deltaproteobacteria bacterium]